MHVIHSHKSKRMSVRTLDIDVGDAIEIAEKIEI